MFSKGEGVEQARVLFALYGAGLFATSLIFFCFYRYANAKRKELELTEIELFDTRWFALEHLFQAVVPVIATTLIFITPPGFLGFSGFSYFLYAVTGYMYGSLHGKGRRMKLAELAA